MRELEARYPDEIVVIGVHSAKFPSERRSEHLAAAVQRLEIRHPVVNDAGFEVWSVYAVRAWPTLMFVDPAGKVVAKHEGEFTLELLEPFLRGALAEYEAAGLLVRGPLQGVRRPQPPSTPLAFPGGVATDGRLLAIADTGHSRVVVATQAGEVMRAVGGSDPGFRDGDAEEARFDHPQGVAFDPDGSAVYVADTENHAIRRIDLPTWRVTTLAGTGEQARRYVSGGPARETDLTSPWDLVVADGTLWIAMAGNHQLWQLPLGSDEVRRFAGSGHEGLRDGAIASAWLAQPSGIDRFGVRKLVFTDSETSSVRLVDLPAGAGRVRTLVGHDLFEFGDVDGTGDTVRLQHPLGVAWDAAGGLLYVADTYNNKIKVLNPATRESRTWLGDGEPGHRDGQGASVRLFEPAGLALAGGTLWIADTNNHAVRAAGLATGDVRTVELRGL